MEEADKAEEATLEARSVIVLSFAKPPTYRTRPTETNDFIAKCEMSWHSDHSRADKKPLPHVRNLSLAGGKASLE